MLVSTESSDEADDWDAATLRALKRAEPRLIAAWNQNSRRYNDALRRTRRR